MQTRNYRDANGGTKSNIPDITVSGSTRIECNRERHIGIC